MITNHTITIPKFFKLFYEIYKPKQVISLSMARKTGKLVKT